MSSTDGVRQMYPGCLTNATLGTCNDYSYLKLLIWAHEGQIYIQSIRNEYVEATVAVSPLTVQFQFIDGVKLLIKAPELPVLTCCWFSEDVACKAAYDFLTYLVYQNYQIAYSRAVPPAPASGPVPTAPPADVAPRQQADRDHVQNYTPEKSFQSTSDYKPHTYTVEKHRTSRHDGTNIKPTQSYYHRRTNRWRYTHRRRKGCCVCCNGSATSNDSMLDWILFLWCVSSFYSPGYNRQQYTCCNTCVIGDLNCMVPCEGNICGDTVLCEGGSCAGCFDLGVENLACAAIPVEMPALDVCALGGLDTNCDAANLCDAIPLDACDADLALAGCCNIDANIDLDMCDSITGACDVGSITEGCAGGVGNCDVGSCDVAGCAEGVDLSACTDALSNIDLSGCMEGCASCGGGAFEAIGGICGSIDLSSIDIGGLLEGCSGVMDLFG